MELLGQSGVSPWRFGLEFLGLNSPGVVPGSAPGAATETSPFPNLFVPEICGTGVARKFAAVKNFHLRVGVIGPMWGIMESWNGWGGEGA